MGIISIRCKPPVESIQVKASRLLKAIEERVEKLEAGPPAARIAAICLRYGVPPLSLRRAWIEGVVLRIGSRSIPLSEGEAVLLKPWVGSPQGLRTVAYHTHKVLKDYRLKVYDVHLLRRIAEGQPPRRIPLRLLKALEQLEHFSEEKKGEKKKD
ncbi:MAG: hypothetical protein QXU69_09320 [Thermofilaceae archaeon]